TAIASAYGYTSDSEQVVIVNGQTTTQNFNLTKAADATISGHVTDGSGHDYGLYADVTVTSANYGQQVADVWTNPTTGAYSVSVPEGDSYTLAVTPAFDGYNPGSATVTNLSGDQTENIPLTVIDSCSAPGYEFVQGGFGEDFNGSFPPPGWQVITPIAGGASWQLNTDYSQGNVTGGTGAAAMADTALTGGAYYTILQSPPIPVTSLPADPILRYKANFQAQDDSTLDLVLDGNGANTLLHWTTSHPPGSLYSLPGDNVSVDLGPYMPSSGSVLLQWQFYDFDSNAWDWYAQIDDVSIGSCQPVSGGMTYGQVTDSNTGKGLVGVNVADNVGDSTKTIQNSADPNLPAGSYLFFTPSSATALTASYGQYTPQTVPFTVQNNQVQTKNFSLKSAQFTANPTSFDLHVMVNNQATKTLTIGNTGNGAGQFNIVAINAPPPGTSSTPAEGRSAPLHLVHGHFSPTNLRSVAMQGRNFTAAREDAHTFAPASSSAAWTAIAPYPVPVVDSCSAADPATGKVYAFTGVSNGTNTASDYAYDPSSDSWSSIADFPNGGLERPVCAELNGKVYITDGDGASGPNNKLYIYDIANNSFTTGADFTGSGTEFAAAGVAFQNNFYVIGGCDGDSCSTFSKGVEVYDPSSNSWSSAANYPTDIAWQGCGVVNGALYCGGGDVSNGSDTTAAYKYDPSSDSWSQVANLLYDNWGMSAIGSNGHLLFQDGITNGTTTLTNQGQSYDAASDSWSALPNNIVATLRSDSACGFYEIGGMDAGDTFTGLASAEILPGYSSCGQNNIPWLTAAPTSATIAAGGSTNVTLTFDGTGQKEFTTSQGYLEVSGSPYPDAIIPLTVTWDPQPIDLAVGGSVSPTGTVKAGDYLAYTIAVQNLPDAAGSATQTELSYEVPANVNYIGINGATCTPPPTTAGIGRSTGGGVKPAMVEGPATVTCDLGTIEPNDSKVVTISVQATAAASSIGATFEASAREPDSDSSNNTLTLQTNPAVGPPGSAGPQGPKGSKGGGSFGWLALAALLGLALAAAAIRKGRNRA
ncbi:MAG: kelch repeat-containing protein, partial [Gammaproteobacteria bacterium]